MNPFVPVSISLGGELAEVAERLRRCTVDVSRRQAAAVIA